MNKTAPPTSRILIAIAFALSCFGLLLFLWVSFGGPIPLKAERYRFTADFPEAFSLAQEAGVRIGGVEVGKVKSIEPSPDSDTSRVTIEVYPDFAPISADTRAILRLKTLLGETYIELTPGSVGGEPQPVALGQAVEMDPELAENVEPIPEGGHLDDSQVVDASQIDELFNALDAETRESFQQWQANAALAVVGRGSDLNDALGNLGPFITDASDVVSILEEQESAVEGLIRDSGEVFEALTERDEELALAITGSRDAFAALDDSDQALVETIRILPTFQREARSLLVRLDEFRENAHPLVEDLIPVASDISPTLAAVRDLSPELEHLFGDVDALIDASIEGLPALRSVLAELGPVFERLDPILANLAPILRYVYAYRHSATDWLANPPSGVAMTLDPQPGQTEPRHSLRQLAYTNAEVLSVYETRIGTNRGNAYPLPLDLLGPDAVAEGMFPNFDCRNTDFTPVSTDPDEDEVDYFEDERVGPTFAPCFIQDTFESRGLDGGRFPTVFADP